MPPRGGRSLLQGNLQVRWIHQETARFSGITIRSSRDRFAASLMRYRVAHRSAATRSGLTQVLGRIENMTESPDRFLVAGANLSAAAALLHLGCIAFGAPWYRFLGAGEQMAQMDLAGHWYPTVATLVISSILLIWSAYALSGAGVIRRLPMTRLALCAITAAYLLRGVGFWLLMPYFPGNSPTFWFWSSAICLVFGLVHLIGLRQVWRRL